MADLAGMHLSEELGRAIHKLRLKTVRAYKQSSEEKKALAKTLTAIGKKWGSDALSPIALMAERNDVPCVSTTFQPLDDIISGHTVFENGKRAWIEGSGRGVPKGRIIEIFGPESSGKTTVALNFVEAFQQRGLVSAYVDVEHAVDMDYAERIGCDTNSWLYSQGGDSAEDTLSMVVDVVKSNTVDIIVVDSVAALTPKAELEGEVGDYHVGVHARLMSQACRKISALLKRGHRTTVVFINQTRSKIGVRYGDPETTPGGNALKFYASVRLRISSLGDIKKGGEKGIRSKIKVRKTKLTVPFGEVFVDITGGNGITGCYSSDPRAKGKKADTEDDD